MPRTIPIPLLNHLQGSLLTTCLLVTITRTDAVVLGLTTANIDLTYTPTGQLYEAMDSVAASQLRQTASTGVDNLLLSGVLSSARITDQDLLAGRYDGAAIDLSIANFQEFPLVNRALLVTGTLGEVTFMDGQYQAEFRSLSQRLQQKIGQLTSATCRVRQLFDSQCMPTGVSFDGTKHPTDFQYNSIPVAAVQSQQQVDFTVTIGSSLVDSGQARFTTGANTGIALEVKNSVQIGAVMRLTFAAPWVFPISVGDLAFIEQGCDRRFTTCVNKFGNAGNNRSEPFLPGNMRVIHWGRR